MRRREFIKLIASGATAWPLTAQAQQQTDKVWRVGYLGVSSATNVPVALFDAFRLKLNDLGYVEGRNLGLYVRRANDDIAQLPRLASELVSLAPDVIVSPATPAGRPRRRFLSSWSHQAIRWAQDLWQVWLGRETTLQACQALPRKSASNSLKSSRRLMRSFRKSRCSGTP